MHKNRGGQCSHKCRKPSSVGTALVRAGTSSCKSCDTTACERGSKPLSWLLFSHPTGSQLRALTCPVKSTKPFLAWCLPVLWLHWREMAGKASSGTQGNHIANRIDLSCHCTFKLDVFSPILHASLLQTIFFLHEPICPSLTFTLAHFL